MEMTIGTIAQLVSAGGVLAYATLVYMQLRAQGDEHRANAERQGELLADVKTLLTLLLERERMRPTPPLGVISGGYRAGTDGEK